MLWKCRIPSICGMLKKRKGTVSSLRVCTSLFITYVTIKCCCFRSHSITNRFMCIAEDIIDMTEDGYTNSMINTFVKECKQYGILLLQCFNKKKLARIFKRGKIVSCICVLKSQRAITDSWKVLVNFIRERKYFSFCCYTLFVNFLPLF